MNTMKKLVTAGAAMGIAAGTLVAPAVALGATAVPDGVVAPAGHKAHEGKRCYSKGKVKTVGNKYHRVKLKCTKVRRGDRHVLVWKYHGRA